MEVRLGHRIERPGADDVVGLGSYVCREKLLVPLVIQTPMRTDLRRERTRKPGVEDVRIRHEAVRLAALIGLVAGRHVHGRVHRHAVEVGHQGVFIIGLARGIERIPDGDRNPEITLPAQAPIKPQVLHPVAVARLHEGRVPVDLGTPRHQFRLMLEKSGKPLPCGQIFEGAISLFEEFHRVLDGLGLALQGRSLPGGAAFRVGQQFHDPLLGLLDVLAHELGVIGVGHLRLQALEEIVPELHLHQATVASDELLEGKALFAPPLHVRRVAKGAHHQDAASLFRVRQLTRKDRHRCMEERRHGVLPEKRLVAFVLGVGGHAHAGGQQFRARRGNVEGSVTALDPELDVVIGAGHGLVFGFGLRNRGLEIHVPHGGRFTRVDQLLVPEITEGSLGNGAAMIIDGLVLLGPVHRKTQALPERAKIRFVVVDERVTGLDEVGPRNHLRGFLAHLGRSLFKLEVRIVRSLRVAANVVVVLHATLRRQPVVVPTHGIEDVQAAHALEAHHDVGLGIRKDMPDMQRARSRGRRRIHHEGFFARSLGIPPVKPALFPRLMPGLFFKTGLEVLGQTRRVDGLQKLCFFIGIAHGVS